MTQASDQLEDKEQGLQREGADPARLHLLRCARAFKRSWVDMAEALVQVRTSRAYLGWGYADLYAYCQGELLMKAHTVDKLTGSYTTLKRHAPAVLEQRNTADIPSYDAVDYFARALGERQADHDRAPGPRQEPPPEVVEELREAVFEQGRPVGALRRKFHDTLFPKGTTERQTEAVRSALRTARRLGDLVASLEGLPEPRRRAGRAALDALARDLEQLLPDDHAVEGAA